MFEIGINFYVFFVFCEGDFPKDWCVIGAIFNYTNQLMDASKNSKSIVHCELDYVNLIFFMFHFTNLLCELHEAE